MNRIGFEKLNNSIHVRLLDNQIRDIEKYATAYNMDKSDIVREAITIWLNQQPKVNSDVVLS